MEESIEALLTPSSEFIKIRCGNCLRVVCKMRAGTNEVQCPNPKCKRRVRAHVTPTDSIVMTSLAPAPAPVDNRLANNPAGPQQPAHT